MDEEDMYTKQVNPPTTFGGFIHLKEPCRVFITTLLSVFAVGSFLAFGLYKDILCGLLFVAACASTMDMVWMATMPPLLCRWHPKLWPQDN